MHHFPVHILPVNPNQDILFKLLTLSTNSVTKKITVLHALYFYNSSSIFATKNFVRSFMRISWQLLDLKNVGWKMVYITFLVRPDFFLLVDLREFFFRSRVGGTKK